MNICVYLSAQEGRDPEYRKFVTELGHLIGSSGNTLVYGGSKSGMMGAVADAVLETGGKVIGVEPRFFVEAEFQHDGITELLITETMNERKEKLIDLSDVFIALPGSTGSLEEIADTASMIKMGFIDKKLIIADYKGFYSPLKKLFENMIEGDFVKREDLSGILFADSLDEIKEKLDNLA